MLAFYGDEFNYPISTVFRLFDANSPLMKIRALSKNELLSELLALFALPPPWLKCRVFPDYDSPPPCLESYSSMVSSSSSKFSSKMARNKFRKIIYPMIIIDMKKNTAL